MSTLGGPSAGAGVVDGEGAVVVGVVVVVIDMGAVVEGERVDGVIAGGGAVSTVLEQATKSPSNATTASSRMPLLPGLKT
ncbi:MAG TPA: hypothetical protein ENH00_10485 [Actinobacteria bacterium]|nr:hypothetical protein [Actinomycetota bacterium]HDK45516.1 hypothetical protein [Actinomycetota bacterium]